jgi:hypothetical protein
MEAIGRSYDRALRREHMRDGRDDDENRAAVHAGRDELCGSGAGAEHQVRGRAFETWIDASRRQTELG